ncbi:MAG: hypothetical protein L0206_17240 [Actinobacteria bacterium]|nr:hypothetical protein [Actinomycetota bacterium]
MGEEQRSGATFHIGSQQGNITNIGGDQVVYGGQQIQVVIAQMPEVEEQLRLVREAFDRMQLADAVRDEAGTALREAEEAAGRTEPDPTRVAGGIERFASILKAAGALAAAGVGLLTPLQTIAAALGPLGRSLLRLLRD